MRRVYEDDNWIVDIMNDNDYNPQIRISYFKDNHFVEDLELSRAVMEDMDIMSEVKNILYK